MNQEEEAVALLHHGQLAGADDEELRLEEKEADGNSSSLPWTSNNTAIRSNSRRLTNCASFLRSPSLPSWSSLVKFGFFLLPSFVQSRIKPEPSRIPRKLKPTAYLDGMRGVAALFVAFCHLSYGPYDIVHGWGFVNPDSKRPAEYKTFLRLPIIRLLYSGTAMVMVFFVVSGYAISYKPIKQMRAGQYSDLLDTLSSAAFRRGLRLFLPCLGSTLFAAILAQLGVYELTRGVAMDANRLTGYREIHSSQKSSILAQLSHWLYANYLYFEPYIWTSPFEWPDYDEHLWTIPVEFRASLILFVTHLGVAKMPPLFRILTVIFLIIMAPFKSGWAMMLFYGGQLCAELDMILNQPQSSLTTSSNASQPPSRLRHGPADLFWAIFWVCGFIIGLFLMSQPWESGITPFWITLSGLPPSGITGKSLFLFWPCVGGLILVFCTGRSPILQKLFDNRFSQYLGRISFALYLMQSWVIHIVGYGAFGFFWGIFGVNATGKAWGFFFGCCVTVPFLIWMADIFWRAVDVKSIEFAKWLEQKMCGNGQ